MILFLYGEDAYRSQRKLEEIRAKFARDIDPTGLNASAVDGTKLNLDELHRAVSSPPFLAKKRLVVLKNALNSAKKKESEALAAILKGIPDDTILVVHERAGSKELAGSPAFEQLKKEKFYPEFLPFSQKELQDWIPAEAKARGVAFDSAALRAYIVGCGNNLWKISNELDGMAAAASAGARAVSEDDVRALTDAETNPSIFDFLDAVGARDASRSAGLLEALLESGESEVALLNRLQSHVKALYVSAALADEGQASKERLARELGLHPFVASKVLMQARRFQAEELRGLYLRLIDADERLKTGRLPKARLSLDLFLLAAAK